MARKVDGPVFGGEEGGTSKRDDRPHGAGKLSIVATPIGNLADISLRALATLRAADVILAEDTRVTGKLLAHHTITTRLERCDENVIAKRAPQIVERIAAGEKVAFVSDAGTPGVSDPGMVLVAAARERGLTVEAIPGASAVLTAIAETGFIAQSFFFGGFLPRKAGDRRRLLEQLKPLDAVLVFYESPHRTVGSLEGIAEVFPARQVAMARELTKMHEEVVSDLAPVLAERIAKRVEMEGELKGEVVLLIGPPDGGRNGSMLPGDTDSSGEDDGTPDVGAAIRTRAEELLAKGNRQKDVVAQLQDEFRAQGVGRNAVYDIVLQAKAAKGKEDASL